MINENNIEPKEDVKNENVTHMIKFFFFSVSAGGIQSVSFTIFQEVLKLPLLSSFLIALTLSILWNFTLNRKFTFKSAANVPNAMMKVAGYYAIYTPVSLWAVRELGNIHWNNYLILFLMMIVNFVTEFFFTKYVVYKNQINTAIPKDETKD